MPRRNLYLLLIVGLVSLVCYHKVQKNRYGQILADVMNEVERRYVEPVSAGELFEGSVRGMLSKLDDYSAYLTPRQMTELEESLEQQFGGIGVEISTDPKTRQVIVLSPMVGGPAYEAGVRAGDQILRIDGTTIQGLSLKDVHDRIRGKPGQPVVLTVMHEGQSTPHDLPIVRAIIRVDTVLGDRRRADGTWDFLLPGKPRLGYVRIVSFGERTAQEVKAALVQLTQQPLEGLILDLRSDPGGLLEQAVEVCRLFVEPGAIVTIRGRNGVVRRAYEADAPGEFRGFPIAVLVNNYTASAAEIVAACLQDQGRAVIVGQRTFGKGSVQEIIQLGEARGSIKLSTATYWRPSGRNIQRPRSDGDKDDWGVLPDKGYQVAVDDAEHEKWLQWRKARDSRSANPAADDQDPRQADRVLAKAVEYLQEAMTRKAQ